MFDSVERHRQKKDFNLLDGKTRIYKINMFLEYFYNEFLSFKTGNIRKNISIIFFFLSLSLDNNQTLLNILNSNTKIIINP